MNALEGNTLKEDALKEDVLNEYVIKKDGSYKKKREIKKLLHRLEILQRVPQCPQPTS